MKLLFFFLAILAQSFAADAQQPLYRASFHDTLFLPRDSAMEASIRNAPGSENIPEQMREQLFQEVFDRMRHQLLLVNVEVFADSSIITMEAEETGNGIHLNLNNARRVWHRNKTGESATAAAKPTGSYKPTGQSKELLGQHCREYVNADGSLTVWVAAALPAGITPGIATGLEGAVLESIQIIPQGGRNHNIIRKLERVAQ